MLIRRSRDSFEPFCNDLEQTSRMDYCAFHDNQHVLNLDSEANVLQWVRTALQGSTQSLAS